MALDITKIQSKLKDLSNASNPKSKMIWKPTPGTKVIRIVPNAQTPDNPFVELKFHYNMNGKTYLSPDTFNRPDPIVEFSNKLKSTGDKDEWKLGKRFEPKMRTYVPIIVRDEEELGVRFWGFGKRVYEQLLSIIADADYGDITDLRTGRDITVEFKSAAEANKDYPETSIRVKPKQTTAVDPTRKDLIDKIKNQPNIFDVWPELSYDELKAVMTAALHPTDEEAGEPADTTVIYNTPVTTAPAATAPTATVTPTVPAKTETKTQPANIEAAFDTLFNTK